MIMFFLLKRRSCSSNASEILSTLLFNLANALLQELKSLLSSTNLSTLFLVRSNSPISNINSFSAKSFWANLRLSIFIFWVKKGELSHKSCISSDSWPPFAFLFSVVLTGTPLLRRTKRSFIISGVVVSINTMLNWNCQNWAISAGASRSICEKNFPERSPNWFE